MLLMSTHNIRFCGEIRNNLLATPSYLELWKYMYVSLFFNGNTAWDFVLNYFLRNFHFKSPVLREIENI